MIEYAGLGMNTDIFKSDVVYTGITWRAVELRPYRTTDEQFVKVCQEFAGKSLMIVLDSWIDDLELLSALRTPRTEA